MADEEKELQQEQSEEQQQSEEKKEPDLGQFKDPQAMFKSYKEIQGAYTKTTQENKELKEELEKIREQQEMSRYNPPAGHNVTQPVEDENFDDLIVENPRKAIESVNAATYQKMRVQEVLEEIQYEDPEAFQSRYSYSQSLSQNPQYAHMANSPVGVRRLFKLGDQLREQESKKNASKALEAILGGPVDDQKIAKLRGVLGMEQQQQQTDTQLGNVYMPDTSDTYRPGLDAQVDKGKDFDKKIAEATADGDIDGVIAAAFGKALAE